MHECPDCGQACYCGGDIDDCEFEENSFCVHCPEGYDEEALDDYWDAEESAAQGDKPEGAAKP